MYSEREREGERGRKAFGIGSVLWTKEYMAIGGKEMERSRLSLKRKENKTVYRGVIVYIHPGSAHKHFHEYRPSRHRPTSTTHTDGCMCSVL